MKVIDVVELKVTFTNETGECSLRFEEELEKLERTIEQLAAKLAEVHGMKVEVAS